jgi:phytoene/squalene synthetase
MRSQKEGFLEIFNSIDFHHIKDHPNILIAANFWEHDRYCAAKACYKFMRAIDDLIDDHKAANKMISPGERIEFVANVNEWLKMITDSEECDPLKKELLETIEQFCIPRWPFEDFAKSMLYDINNDGFPTLNAFLDYAYGASVAPATIFVHLSGLTKQNGQYKVPPFDIKDASIPCAIFSYIVHIIRDFQKDQINNLNYFADDLIIQNNLTRKDLNEFAHGRPVTDDFRNLISVYLTLADHYRLKTRNQIMKVSSMVKPRYQLSLEIIFDLYMMVFERIDVKKGSFTSEELNPTPEETRERVYEAILKFCGKNY